MASKIKLLASACLLLFSAWLMWQTFSYNSQSHQILISGKAWSDFGGYLPQIRSFSKGDNWPPQYPMYPGEPTRYHFLFYLIAGLLEKVGLRLDWAINLPSAIGFFLLLIMIWKLSFALFKNAWVSALSILFFLFNGSFSFLDFLSKHPLSIHTPSEIFNNSVFPSFGPWNGSLIAAFWNLNVYTNQRHLALSYAIALAVIYFLYKDYRKYSFLTGFMVGSFLLLNQAVVPIVGMFAGWFLIFRPNLHIPMLVSGLGMIPWLALSTLISHVSPPIHFQIGFLTPNPVTIFSFIRFWFYNFGLHLILIPLGFVAAPKKAKILIIPLLILFLVPNLFQLSVDMINNHKFFNFFLIISLMYSANFIVNLGKSGLLGKVLMILIFPFLIMGGIVDFFPVKNDHYFALTDAPANPDINFFLNSTPPDAVVLNSTWFYHPASLAGRFIYNGYSYFVWSFGYNQTQREKNTLAIYQADSKQAACSLLQLENISYVELQNHPEEFIKPNWSLWDRQFVPIYLNADSGLRIYSVSQNCHEV